MGLLYESFLKSFNSDPQGKKIDLTNLLWVIQASQMTPQVFSWTKYYLSKKTEESVDTLELSEVPKIYD